MQIQNVTFSLEHMNHEEYLALCDELAPVFAGLPGLVSKVWLSDPETNTYGGVYTWSDRASLERYKASEVFASVAANPNFVNIVSVEFEVIEAPTGVTRGLAAVAAR